MTQLDSRPPAAPDRARTPWPRWATIVIGVVLVALLAGIGFIVFDGSEVSAPTTPVPTTTPDTAPITTSQPSIPPIATDTTLYFMADYAERAYLAGPHLVPVRRSVAMTAEASSPRDVIEAALVALIEGPSSDDADIFDSIFTNVPPQTAVLGVTLDEPTGVATIDLSGDYEAGGGTSTMTARLAQVVYTATHVPEVQAVLFAIEGEPVRVFSGEGIVLDGPQTREGHRSMLPLIFVEAPYGGKPVASPVAIQGVSNTFEGTLQYALETVDGAVLAKGFTNATCGSGCWGTFDFTAEYTLADSTAGYVVLFEQSAVDGLPINRVRIPVTFAAVP